MENCQGCANYPFSVRYLVIGLGLLTSFVLKGIGPSLATVTVGHIVIDTPLCLAIRSTAIGDAQLNAERAARDPGASEFPVITLITTPMILPALLAAFRQSVTFPWDELIIAFLPVVVAGVALLGWQARGIRTALL